MALTIRVTETEAELKLMLSRCAAGHRPRVKMLLLLLTDGWLSNEVLAAKTGVSLRTIAGLNLYTTGGTAALLSENRGAYWRSGLNAADKQKIADRLSDPKNAGCGLKCMMRVRFV